MGERENHVIFKALVDITMVMLNRNMVAKVELSENLTFVVPLNINLHVKVKIRPNPKNRTKNGQNSVLVRNF